MINYSEIIEGYLVAYGPYLWMVKGCEHPRNYFIAYPRYSRLDGSKIKDPARWYAIAKDLGVLKYFDCLKMEVPLIPRDSIKFVLDPFDKKSWPSLPNNVMNFLNSINAFNSEVIGLTGSYLVSKILPLKPRDLDLIIKDKNEGLRIYNELLNLRGKGLIKPYVESMDFDGTDPRSRNELLRYRILEGVFNNDLVYSIRVLSCIKNREPICIKRVEYYSGKISIAKALSPFIMPYEYEAITEDLNKILVRSQRMRFSEMPTDIDLLVSNCRLEYYENDNVYLSLDNPGCTVKILG